MMEKKMITWHGNKYYLLGSGQNGINYWLQEASWDCGWYWGGGYVETFSNNRCPALSKDIVTHNHFKNMVFNKNLDGFKAFKDTFPENPFTDKEIWKILELMKAFYIANQYSDMIYDGNAHYTKNPVADIIKSEDEYNRINKTVIPAIMNALYKIMDGSEDEK